MKIRTIQDVEDLKATVGECSRDVWLEGPDGRRYDLKSALGQYIAIGALLEDSNDQLELYAAAREDRMRLVDFIGRHIA